MAQTVKIGKQEESDFTYYTARTVTIAGEQIGTIWTDIHSGWMEFEPLGKRVVAKHLRDSEHIKARSAGSWNLSELRSIIQESFDPQPKSGQVDGRRHDKMALVVNEMIYRDEPFVVSDHIGGEKRPVVTVTVKRPESSGDTVEFVCDHYGVGGRQHRAPHT